ncbi:MAG: WYL domain-containing protein [Chitinophagales bacterium]
MSAQQKIFRIFNLIARLRAPLGSSKTALANDLGVSTRTIERYFELLQSIGFDIAQNKNRFRIENLSNKNLEYENSIVFSLEEAALVRNSLLDHSSGNHILRKSLLEKLYALTDIEEIGTELQALQSSKNISEIRAAIKNKQQVILKNYSSANSHTEKDRLVEPIRFIQYYRYLMAFEVSTKRIKQYKCDRFPTAEILPKKWKHEHLHQIQSTDIFGMSGNEDFKVKLGLSKRAAKLLSEEYPESSHLIVEKKGKRIFETKVYSNKGIGRFVMGLIDEIEVLEPESLKVYIREKVKKI